MTMPFRVVADPAEFAFTILHDDQSREPSLALSTGQGLCLGIAFWLARASVFESQFPFFVLDEPTANVDEKNVLAVAESIGALASQMAKEGRQGIVITHHAAVAAAATQRVSLGY